MIHVYYVYAVREQYEESGKDHDIKKYKWPAVVKILKIESSPFPSGIWQVECVVAISRWLVCQSEGLYDTEQCTPLAVELHENHLPDTNHLKMTEKKKKKSTITRWTDE